MCIAIKKYYMVMRVVDGYIDTLNRTVRLVSMDRNKSYGLDLLGHKQKCGCRTSYSLNGTICDEIVTFDTVEDAESAFKTVISSRFVTPYNLNGKEKYRVVEVSEFVKRFHDQFHTLPNQFDRQVYFFT